MRNIGSQAMVEPSGNQDIEQFNPPIYDMVRF